jgi:hypothetical protein
MKLHIAEWVVVALFLCNLVAYPYIIGRDGWRSVSHNMSYSIRHPRSMFP